IPATGRSAALSAPRQTTRVRGSPRADAATTNGWPMVSLIACAWTRSRVAASGRPIASAGTMRCRARASTALSAPVEERRPASGDEDERERRQERRRREQHDRRGADDARQDPARPRSRDDAERNPDEGGEQQRREREDRGVGCAFGNQVADRTVVQHRAAEIE